MMKRNFRCGCDTCALDLSRITFSRFTHVAGRSAKAKSLMWIVMTSLNGKLDVWMCIGPTHVSVSLGVVSISCMS